MENNTYERCSKKTLKHTSESISGVSCILHEGTPCQNADLGQHACAVATPDCPTGVYSYIPCPHFITNTAQACISDACSACSDAWDGSYKRGIQKVCLQPTSVQSVQYCSWSYNPLVSSPSSTAVGVTAH
jgi:hypothetical protein